MGMDATCRLCSPRDERLGAGCGGVGLTQEDVLNSNLLSVCGTILIRFVIGPVTEQLGPRLTYTYLLLCMSLPGFFAAGVWNAGSFLVARLFISFAGGAFVVTQIWTALMFDSKVIGLASALRGGATLAAASHSWQQVPYSQPCSPAASPTTAPGAPRLSCRQSCCCWWHSSSCSPPTTHLSVASPQTHLQAKRGPIPQAAARSSKCSGWPRATGERGFFSSATTSRSVLSLSSTVIWRCISLENSRSTKARRACVRASLACATSLRALSAASSRIV